MSDRLGMSESTLALGRSRRSARVLATAVVALLAAAAVLTSCGGEPQPVSPTEPAATPGQPATPTQPAAIPTQPAATPDDTTASTPVPTEAPPPTATPRPATRQVSSEIRSDRDRAAPAAGSGDVTALVEGNSAFAFDLFEALRAEDGNLFYSPHSIAMALAMTYAGADGQTASQMADTIRFSLAQDRLHPALNALDQELAGRGADVQRRDGERFRLNIVNAVWGQHDHGFREAFLDVLAESYGAGVRSTDFKGSPEESRTAINDWVAASTQDRIKDLVPEGIINPLTRMVLTNAIYFSAYWSSPFNEADNTCAPLPPPGRRQRRRSNDENGGGVRLCGGRRIPGCGPAVPGA